MMFNPKEYYQKNKKYILQRTNNYNKLHQEKKREYDKEYRIKNKEKRKIQHKEYYQKNIIKWQKYYQAKLKLWEGYIPKKSNCQICGRSIYFNQNCIEKAIHFDHKNENILIKKNPTIWLSQYECSLENRKIWEECKFGMLCNRCNGYLPTKNRLKILNNLIQYIKNGLY